MPRAFIPPGLRPLAGGVESVDVEATDVGGVLAELDRRFPGIRSKLCDGSDLRPDLCVAVDDRIASRGLAEPVPEQAEVHFLPAVGGG